MKKFTLILASLVVFAGISFAKQTNPDPAKNQPTQTKTTKTAKSDKNATNKETKKTDKKTTSGKTTK